MSGAIGPGAGASVIGAGAGTPAIGPGAGAGAGESAIGPGAGASWLTSDKNVVVCGQSAVLMCVPPVPRHMMCPAMSATSMLPLVMSEGPCE